MKKIARGYDIIPSDTSFDLFLSTRACVQKQTYTVTHCTGRGTSTVRENKTVLL